MAWYDYINPINGLKALKSGVGGALNSLGLNGLTPDAQAQVDKLNQVGAGAQGFADTAQQNYADLTGRLTGSLNDLQALANGQNSISAMQLQQAQRANLAQQRSLAAGAAPQNAAMAARAAANNMAKMSYGLSGQQALAGLAERQAAQKAYADLLSTSRGQDLQGTIGGYQAATNAYGGGLNAEANAPTLGGSLLGGIQALGFMGSQGKGK